MRECRLARLRAVVLFLALALGVGGAPCPAGAQAAGDPPEPVDAPAAGDSPEPADAPAAGDPPEPADAPAAGDPSGPAGPDPVAALDAYDPLFDDPEDSPAGLDADPLEGANRQIFAFNNRVDRWILDPITDGYRFLVPGPVRRGVNRMILNVNAPVVFANQVLQLRPRAAARTVGRFAANSTLGLVGVFDFAGDVMGLPHVEADFGQTLSRYGVPPGAYLMIPVLGPTTARDAVGSVADYLLDPITYLVGPLNLEWQLLLGGGEGLASYDSHEEGLDALRSSSIDFYAALRSAYLQSRRKAEIEARSEGCGKADEASLPVADAQAEAAVSAEPEAEPF